MTVETAPSERLELPLIRCGKVRDIYRFDGNLLLVATDRISAFDQVLPTAIPHKGAVLNQLSAFWFSKTSQVIPNHLLSVGLPETVAVPAGQRQWFDTRTSVAKHAKRIDLECVVRGYLAGSAWKEYLATGHIAGQALPVGLVQSERLPKPMFTPAIKNDLGHDENISASHLQEIVGRDLADRLEQISLSIYAIAATYANSRGIIIADSKFEFGFVDGQLTLIDELLTPDSSRFWPREDYEPGRDQRSFDKQFVRDWLTTQQWNREPPAPELPIEIVEGTTARYLEAFRALTGRDLVVEAGSSV